MLDLMVLNFFLYTYENICEPYISSDRQISKHSCLLSSLECLIAVNGCGEGENHESQLAPRD